MNEEEACIKIQSTVRSYLRKFKNTIIIQRYIRGYLVRSENLKLKDEIKKWKTIRENKIYKGLDIIPKCELRKLYQIYRNKMIDFHEKERNISKYLGRVENFPDYISENIVLYALMKKNIKCTWKTKSGDIYYFKDELKIKGEIKCAQNGPSQLSPSAEWNTLFYIDARDHLYGNIIIYMIENIFDIMQNISISKTQTIKEQSEQGRRPRSDLNILLSDYIKSDNILFKGKISSLVY